MGTVVAPLSSCSFVRSSLLVVLPVVLLSPSHIAEAQSRAYGSWCRLDSGCSFEHGFCRDRKKCDCVDNYTYNKTSRACVIASCNADTDCKGVGWVCKNYKCDCDDAYYLEDEQCTKKKVGLDHACAVASDCGLVNSIRSLQCLNARCSCELGFRPTANKTDCVPLVGLGGNCSVSAECGLFNSSRRLQCLHGRCICEHGFREIFNNTDCVPMVGLGKSCSLNEECKPTLSAKPTECWKGVCSCKPGLRATPSLDCGPSVIGGACSDDRECQFAPNSTICVNNTCACKTFFVPSKKRNDTCLQSAAMGVFCEESQQCDSSNSMCEKNICVCKKGYRLKKTECVKDTGQF
ncbi:protein draper-like isoform X2 [Periplaneta americana]|uniref:protein draper-like isoform X2 n=1 Tax=Periplaneta americana TaxID=6978 RepID=UPI0037E933B0